MYSELLTIAEWQGSTIKYGDIQYLRRRYAEEIAKAKKHLTGMTGSINNKHFLCRLSGLLLSLYKPDVDEFISSIYFEKNGIDRMFGFISAVNGLNKDHVYYLYNQESACYFLSTYSVFATDIGPADGCLRVISHPFSDTSIGFANGRYTSALKESGACFIIFDLAVFAYKLHRWFSQKQANDIDEGDFIEFVSRYVLTDLLESHLDVAVFNRFSKIVRGDTLSPFYSVYPVGMVNFDSKLDGVLEQYANYFLRNNNVVYEKILASIPALTAQNMGGVFHVSDVLINDVNGWWVFVSRVPLYLFLITLTGDSNRNESKVLKNKVSKLLTVIESQKSVIATLPDYTRRQIERLRFLVGGGL